MIELKEICKEYIKTVEALRIHKCKHRWCPGYDIGCEEADTLSSREWELFELMEKACID